VLDTSALLAYLAGEQGGEIVAGLIGDAVVSAVNYSEAVGKLVERTGSLEVARRTLGVTEFDIAAFDRALAERTGALLAHTRKLGLSLGDRACLALAERENLPAVTADRVWRKLNIGVDIRLIR
jgi:PIN domain nuclease of toxin-antitoxin system